MLRVGVVTVWGECHVLGSSVFLLCATCATCGSHSVEEDNSVPLACEKEQDSGPQHIQYTCVGGAVWCAGGHLGTHAGAGYCLTHSEGVQDGISLRQSFLEPFHCM